MARRRRRARECRENPADSVWPWVIGLTGVGLVVGGGIYLYSQQQALAAAPTDLTKLDTSVGDGTSSGATTTSTPASPAAGGTTTATTPAAG